MTLREYLQRIQADTAAALALMDAPPSWYNLRTDRDIVPLPPLPAMPERGFVVDPSFGTTIHRLTNQTTRINKSSWGTPSAPALNAWSSDGKRFYVVSDDGSSVLPFTFTDGVAVRGVELTFLTEPCFARVPSKPNILYAPHYNYVVTAFDLSTGARKVLLAVTDDVGPLSQNSSTAYPSGSYMNSCYGSAGPTERIAVMYGDIQELHRYMTVFDADAPTRRLTLNTRTSQIKVNGMGWEQLLRPDGTPANINFGLHSIAIDRSGKWVHLHISGRDGGSARTAFLNVETRRLHEWTSNAWYGHSCLGYESHVTCIADPNGGAMYQWLLTDLTKPGFPPPWRPLIVPPMQGDHYLVDHNSWNNARPDKLVPFISGTGRSGLNTKWGPWYEEIVAVAVEGPTTVWRACHHRMTTINAAGQLVYTFRDSPRPQVSPDGQWVLFTSNWGLTLGAFGTALPNHRRDAFLVKMAR